MTARTIAWVALAGVGAGAAGAAVWYFRSGSTSDESAVVATAPPPPAPVRTLQTHGPETLLLKVVQYQGLPTLGSGTDTAGTSTDLSGIFSQVQLNIVIVPDGPRVHSAGFTGTVTKADLDSLSTEPQAPGTGWKVTAFMLGKGPDPHDRGVLLRDSDGRNQFAVFTSAHSNSSRILRTSAHELGHALNLFHDDGDADIPCCASAGRSNGKSIMNQDRCLDQSRWLLTLRTSERRHLLEHPMADIEPGTRVPFGACTGGGHARSC